MRLILQFALFLGLLIFGIIVGTQNSTQVTMHFFHKTYEQIPLWMLLLSAFAVGAAVSLLFCAFEIMRLWYKIIGLRRRAKAAGVTMSDPDDDGPDVMTGEIVSSSPTQT